MEISTYHNLDIQWSQCATCGRRYLRLPQRLWYLGYGEGQALSIQEYGWWLLLLWVGVLGGDGGWRVGGRDGLVFIAWILGELMVRHVLHLVLLIIVPMTRILNLIVLGSPHHLLLH